MSRTAENTTSTEVATLPPQALGIIESLGIKYADPNVIQWRIAERLATATSLEDLLSDSGPEGLRNHIDEPFVILNVEYLKSNFPAMPVYALISGVNDDGEPVVYTTGALSVVIQLAKGMQMGWWENERIKAKWSTDQPGPDGNRPYMLTKA